MRIRLALCAEAVTRIEDEDYVMNMVFALFFVSFSCVAADDARQ